MQGLEAFYVEGKGDMRRQLTEKIPLWLGKWENNKNIVGDLYNLRSIFVHGATKLTYWGEFHDPWDEDAKRMSDFFNSTLLATQILLATLQKCVIEKVTDIDWHYSYTLI